MTTTNPYIARQLRQLIHYFLDNNLFSNALFLATYLQSHEPHCDDSLYLLSLCYLRVDELQLAAEFSKISGAEGHHIGCTYVFAQCCLGRDRFKDGIDALVSSRQSWDNMNGWNKHSEEERWFLPDTAALLCLLGKLYHGYNDSQRAISSYIEALKVNPFMWDAFTGLCNTGANIQVPNIFKATSEMLSFQLNNCLAEGSRLPSSAVQDLSFDTITYVQSAKAASVDLSSTKDPFGTSTRHNTQHVLGVSGDLHKSKKLHSNKYASGGVVPGVRVSVPSKRSTIRNSTSTAEPGGRDEIYATAILDVPQDPRENTTSHLGVSDVTGESQSTHPNPSGHDLSDRIIGNMEDLGKSFISAATMVGQKRKLSQQSVDPYHKEVPEKIGTRRSSRLISQYRSSNKLSLSTSKISGYETRDSKKLKIQSPRFAATSSSLTVGNTEPLNLDFKNIGMSALPKRSTQTPDTAIAEASQYENGIYWLLDLFKKMGSGYFLATHFKNMDALRMYKSIPKAQRETKWVLSQMAKVHFQQNDYAESAKIFSKVRAIAPLSVEDMDIYSTALWHLEQDIELAFLSHELMDLNRMAPQTWCALGNSFSLNKDRDHATKCFRRATQLNPKFAYAFTLKGHEHIINEEYDEAKMAFQSAVGVDRRDYSAWYGLGLVYMKTGNLDMAEKYIRSASKINPRNAVLLRDLGMVLEKRKQPMIALVCYSRACKISPESIFVRERIVCILLEQKDVDRASVELETLRDLAPNNSDVHILLGRMYKMKKDRGNALKSYTIAHSLDPQAGHKIKDEIEAIENDDEPSTISCP